ncbi:MAG TPA: hypothetical protein V6D00_05695 [Pantanalinema sp.]
MQKSPQKKTPVLRHIWYPSFLEEARRHQGPTWLRYGVLGAWFAMLVLNAFSSALLPRTIQEVSQTRAPLYLDPAPYAFSIWGLIFLGLGAYAAYQWIPIHPRGARLAETRAPMLVSMACGALWPVAIAYEQMPLAMGLVIGMLAGAAFAYRRFQGEQAKGVAQRLCVSWPLGLYLGWLSIATVLSVTGVMTDEMGVRSFLLPPVAWAALAILAMGGLGAAMGFLNRDWAFDAALVWGLVAIAGEQRTPPIGWAVVFAVGLVVFALIAGSKRVRPSTFP